MASFSKSKSALVLAGGGMTGADYEIGALTALDRLFAPGFSSSCFDVYVGTSAGSILATLVANRMKPLDIFRAISDNKPSLFNWRRDDIYRIDRREIWSNLRAVIANVFRVIKTYKLKRWDLSLTEILHIFQEQLPAGLYSLDPLQSYLCINQNKQIVVGDHVWIGCRSTVLKGSVIPDNSVIAAGCLVTGPFTKTNQIIGGTPARTLRENINWKE